jgi:peptidyl-prolyl cis-trans isomerase SurA
MSDDARAQAKYANGIAAVVNDKIITLDQLRKQVDPVYQRIYAEADVNFPDDPAGAQKYVHEQLLQLYSNLLHGMVDNILIIQAFHDQGYSIPKSYLDQMFDENMTTKFNGDREAFLNYLKQSSLTERQYRDQLQDDVILSVMREKLRTSTNGVSPDRIVKYYNDNKQQWYQDAAVKLRQITLQPSGDSTDLLMQQAREIVQQARAPGADFAALAIKYSQDENREKGGDVGWVEKGKLVDPMETAAFSLSPGQVSDPVTSGGNVYIFKCEDKRDAGIQPLEKVHADIEYALTTADARDAEEKWLEKLRKNAYIKYNM